MKTSFVLISAIAVATAGFAVSSNAIASPPDAQAQAAALLSPSHGGVKEKETTSSQSVALGAQVHAAALLSGVRVHREVGASALVTRSHPSGDAQAQAAALLSGLRGTSIEDERTPAI